MICLGRVVGDSRNHFVRFLDSYPVCSSRRGAAGFADGSGYRGHVIGLDRFWREKFSRTVALRFAVVLVPPVCRRLGLCESSRNSFRKMKFFDDPSCPVTRREVYFDVDEDHDAAGNVEGPEGRVHHVPDVFAQLQKC